METLTCNSCGAPLEVPASTNYVKCNHCGQQLVVRRSDSATFTEVVDRLTQTADAMSQQVEELSRQNRIAQIDRRWEQERESYLIADKHGHRHLPTESSSVIGGIVMTVFGCFWTATAIGITSNVPDIGPARIARFVVPAFGVFFVVSGIVMSLRNYSKAKDYREAKRRYQAERAHASTDSR